MVGVTKGFGPDAVRAARGGRAARPGRELRGRARAKAPAARRRHVVWHFLGAVQRNKVRAAGPARRPVAEGGPGRPRASASPARARGRACWSRSTRPGLPGRNGCRPAEVADAGRRASATLGLRRAGAHDGGATRTAGGAARPSAGRAAGRRAGPGGALDGDERRPRGGGGRRLHHGAGRRALFGDATARSRWSDAGRWTRRGRESLSWLSRGPPLPSRHYAVPGQEKAWHPRS